MRPSYRNSLGGAACTGAALVLALALAPPASAQLSSGTSLVEWGRALALDPRVVDELKRYRGDARPLPVEYGRELAWSARREIFERAGRAVSRLVDGGCEPSLDVSFDEPPMALRGPGDSRSGVEEAFEESLLRIEMVACLETAAADPAEALQAYTDPGFRRSVESRIERIWEEDDLSCVATSGVTALLDPTRACNRIDRYADGTVTAEHSQVVANPVERDDSHQIVYFKESLKTFVRLPDGIALHYVHLSRTANLGRLSRWIGGAKVRESEERKVAALDDVLGR